MWSFEILHEYLPSCLPKDVQKIIISYNYQPLSKLKSAEENIKMALQHDKYVIEEYLSTINNVMRECANLPWRCSINWRNCYFLTDQQVFQIIKYELEKQGYKVYRIEATKDDRLSLCWTFPFLYYKTVNK